MARPRGAKTRKVNPMKTDPNKWSATRREELKAEVQKLDRRGFSEAEIAGKMVDVVSRSTIRNFLIEIRRDYQAAYVDDRKRKAAECEAAHREVIATCWENIELLRARGRRRKTTKSGTAPGDKGGPWDEEAETVEDADVAGYLALITDNWKQIFALYGLKDLPTQVFAQINVGGEVGRDEFDRLGEMLLGAMGVRAKETPAVGGGPRVVVEPGKIGDVEPTPEEPRGEG